MNEKLRDELSDKTTEIQIDMQKARCLLNDISQEYFGKYDPCDERDRQLICVDFERMKTKTDIIVDYLYSVYKCLESVVNKLDELYT